MARLRSRDSSEGERIEADTEGGLDSLAQGDNLRNGSYSSSSSSSSGSSTALSLESLIAKVRAYIDRLLKVPIFQFYLYLWQKKRRLFLWTVFANYLFPAILDAAPWYLSVVKLSKEIRDSRSSLHHNLVGAYSFFSFFLLLYFLLFRLVRFFCHHFYFHSFLHSALY